MTAHHDGRGRHLGGTESIVLAIEATVLMIAGSELGRGSGTGGVGMTTHDVIVRVHDGSVIRIEDMEKGRIRNRTVAKRVVPLSGQSLVTCMYSLLSHILLLFYGDVVHAECAPRGFAFIGLRMWLRP